MVQIGKQISLKENLIYSSSCSPYERHPGLPPADPYYGGGLPPHGPPPPIDPYHNYDPYQKYYAGRARDPEYPGQRFVIDFDHIRKNKILVVFFLVNMIYIQIIVMIHME
jgi:hypothetical protein